MLSKSFGGDNCKSETRECESRMRGIQSCTALAPNITYKKLVEVGRGMTRVQNHVHTHRAKTARGDKLTVNIEHVDFTTACGFFGRHPSYHLRIQAANRLFTICSVFLVSRHHHFQALRSIFYSPAFVYCVVACFPLSPYQ